MKNFFPNLFSVILLSFLISLTSHATTAEQELTQMLKHTKDANTDVVLVYKDGKVIYQNYARGYGPNTKHLSWSVGKTISGILIGIAEAEGLLSLNDPVKKYFPQFKSSARIMDLLGMSSGLRFKEVYDGLPVDLDITNMMYSQGVQTGFANYAAALPLAPNAPGDYFNYSSGNTNLLMAILQKAIGSQSVYNKYPWEKFFNPLGIEATFEQDAHGTFVGASYIYMKASDFLKVGQLLVNKGFWNGRQIIPARYFNLMNTVADGVQKKVETGNSTTRAYSAQVTTNLPIPGRNLPSEYNDLPLDALIMIGHQGQIVAASPSQNLVIVKLAMDKKNMNTKMFYAAVKKFIFSRGFKLETVGTENNLIEDDQSVDQRSLIGTLFGIPHLLRSFSVKEYCSCRFVVGRTEAECKTDLKSHFPVLPRLKIQDNIVTATLGLGISKKAQAVYRGKSLGCWLTQSE